MQTLSGRFSTRGERGLGEPERPRPPEAFRPREGDLLRESLVSRDRDRDLSLPPLLPFFPFVLLDFTLPPFLQFPLLPFDPLDAEREARFVLLRNPAHRVSCVRGQPSTVHLPKRIIYLHVPGGCVSPSAIGATRLRDDSRYSFAISSARSRLVWLWIWRCR